MKKTYYGNIVVFIMAVMMIPMCLIMNTASIFYTPVTQELDIPLAAFGAHLTIIMLGSAFGAPFVSTPLTKRFKLRWLIAAAVTLEAACFAVRAMANSIFVIYLTSILISFPMGLLCNISIPIIANNWFPNRPGTAIGVIASTQGLGGMAFSAIGGVLIGIIGWRSTYLVWGAICLVCAPLAAIFIRNEPSEVGQAAPGATEVKKSIDPALLPGMTRSHALRTSMFWMCALVLIMSSFTANVNSYINPYCQSMGMSSAMAGLISAAIQGGVFVNKIVLGNICDKKGLRVGGMYYVGSAIICFLLILFGGSNFAPVAVACFLLGPLYSSVNLYGPMLTRYVFGPKDQPAIWAAFVLLFCSFGGSAATLWGIIQGAVGYAGAFWAVCGMLVVLGSLILIVLSKREKFTKQWDTPAA